jgi:hypothetical protein
MAAVVAQEQIRGSKKPATSVGRRPRRAEFDGVSASKEGAVQATALWAAGCLIRQKAQSGDHG